MPATSEDLNTGTPLGNEIDRLRRALRRIEAEPVLWQLGVDENMERLRSIARAALNGEEG